MGIDEGPAEAEEISVQVGVTEKRQASPELIKSEQKIGENKHQQVSNETEGVKQEGSGKSEDLKQKNEICRKNLQRTKNTVLFSDEVCANVVNKGASSKIFQSGLECVA